jgi:hypothetical protein
VFGAVLFLLSPSDIFKPSIRFCVYHERNHSNNSKGLHNLCPCTTGIAKERHQSVVFARYIAIQLFREADFTMERIGEAFHRSRQGISKSLQAHEILYETNAAYRAVFEATRIVLQAGSKRTHPHTL